MKVLITTPIIHPENHATSKYLKAILSAPKTNLEFTTIAFGKNYRNTKVENTIIEKDQNFAIKILKFTLVLFKKIPNTDIVFSQHALVSTIPSLLLSFIFRKKIVVNFPLDEIYERYLNIHKNNISLENFYKLSEISFYLKVLQTVQMLVLKMSTKIIVPNQYFKNIISKKYNICSEKIFVVYPFINTEIKIAFEPTREEFTFMTQISVSLDVLEKIQEVVLALNHCRQNYPKIRLHIFGDGNGKESLQNFLIQNQFNFVTLHGKVSEAEIYYFRKISQYFVLNSPSVRNIFHLLENFRSKTICIARENKLANEYIGEENNGLLFQSKADLETKILKVLSDTKLRNKIIEQAYADIENEHTIERYLERLTLVLR